MYITSDYIRWKTFEFFFYEISKSRKQNILTKFNSDDSNKISDRLPISSIPTKKKQLIIISLRNLFLILTFKRFNLDLILSS